MNQDNQVKIVCPRCGNQIDITSRCCLNCGWLNPNDPANQNMQQFVNKNETSVYQVGSGQSIVESKGLTTSVVSNTGNKTLCFVINYLIYLLIIIASFIVILGNGVIDFYIVKNSLFPYVLFSTSVVFLYVYSLELIYMKCNRKWWYSLIPVFNLFVLTDIVYKKKWLGILLLIPIVGQIFLLVLLYKLATRFKYNGLLAIIFPIIYIPLMGFGSRLYEGINYVSEDKTLEKDYKRKKTFFVTIVVFLLLGGSFIFWNNIIEIKSHAFRLKNYYYVLATKQIVKKTEQLAKENYLECEGSSYKENSGIYYVEYADIGDVAYIPFHMYTDVIFGYVIIDNTSGESKYYVSLSDGTYGYPETLSDAVTIDTIVPYEKLERKTNVNICVNKKPKASVGGMK